MAIDTVKAGQAKTALINTGVTAPVLSFALAQAAFESSGFTSNVFDSYNNASGIEFVGQEAATDSAAKKQDGGTFAAFDSLNLWAQDFTRILSLQRSGNTIGAPIDATDLRDYVNRLQANNYFGEGDPVGYYNGLNNYLQQINNSDISGDASLSTNKVWQTAQTVGRLAIASENIIMTGAAFVIILVCFVIVIFNRKNKKNV